MLELGRGEAEVRLEPAAFLPDGLLPLDSVQVARQVGRGPPDVLVHQNLRGVFDGRVVLPHVVSDFVLVTRQYAGRRQAVDLRVVLSPHERGGLQLSPAVEGRLDQDIVHLSLLSRSLLFVVVERGFGLPFESRATGASCACRLVR